jgi:hypothetical protein
VQAWQGVDNLSVEAAAACSVGVGNNNLIRELNAVSRILVSLAFY